MNLVRQQQLQNLLEVYYNNKTNSDETNVCMYVCIYHCLSPAHTPNTAGATGKKEEKLQKEA